MRSLMLTLGLLALSLSLMFGGTCVLKRTCEQMFIMAQSYSHTEKEKVLSQMQELWEARSFVLCSIAPRSDIRRVEDLLLTLRGCLNAPMTSENVLSEQIALAQLRGELNELKKDNSRLL
jgi:hypothetical protein